ncbi:putative topoisomerase [Cryptosporidium felis]|nr:putative topoisomerase [Cryptosporidium felis]
MDLIEDVILFYLEKLTSINTFNLINSVNFRNNTNKKKKNDIANIARALSISNILHNALQEKRRLTLRELYYQNTHLFKDQYQVNRIAQKILRVPRKSLGIFPSPKGMIGGRVELICNKFNIEEFGVIGATISDIFEIDGELTVLTSAKYLLIIEKASVFQYLMDREIYNRIPCLVVTGKFQKQLLFSHWLQKERDSRIFPQESLYQILLENPT